MSTRFTSAQLEQLLHARMQYAIVNSYVRPVPVQPVNIFSKWTDEEVALLRERYKISTGVDLKLISQEMDRTHAAVALKASRMGITAKRGKHTRSIAARKSISRAQMEIGSRPEIKKARSLATSRAWKIYGHPRGFKGHHRTPEEITRFTAMTTGRKRPPEEIDAMLRTRLKNHGTLAPREGHKGCSWKQGWRKINGQRIFFRSRWEFNYALYLEFLRKIAKILSWEHEPDTFWFEGIRRGVRSYLPDFKVTLLNGDIEYHEVKGWMDPRSITKLKRMQKYHPTVMIHVIQSDWFKTTGRQMRNLLPGWEK